jgi:hypothetical protein
MVAELLPLYCNSAKCATDYGRWEYLRLGAGFSREEEMEDTRREVEK